MKKGVPIKSKTVPKNIMAAFISRQNFQVPNIIFFVNVIMLAIFSKIKYCKIKSIGRRLSYRSRNTVKDLSHCNFSPALRDSKG